MITRLVFLSILSCAFALQAAEENWVSLFNGRDLNGWVNVNCAPETWTVQDGTIHCTGKPTGALRTPREYENFILELDWRHLSVGGNSGVFIWASPIAAPGVPFLRAIEVQVLDNGFNIPGKNQWYTTHGDVFPIHGSSMTPFGKHNGSRSFPSEERSNSSPDWNHYRITCQNGTIRLAVNGKEVSGGENCNYRKGYLGLESEGGPIDFKNIRIQELPPADASPDNTAPEDQRWQSLFTGLDLRGWHTDAAAAWKVEGEVLHAISKEGSGPADLWTDQSFGTVEFVIDCRVPKSAETSGSVQPTLYPRGEKGPAIPLRMPKPGEYHRFVIRVDGQQATASLDGNRPESIPLGSPLTERGPLGIRMSRGSAEFRNIYHRTL
jgi:hypothetical protein